VIATALFMPGCAHLNDPFRDSGAAINGDMTTPSAEGFSARTQKSSALRRSSEPAVVFYSNGAVTHWPLWFEDPFEDRGNTDVTMRDPAKERDLPDNVFAWNWVDYFDLAYSPARYMVNLVAFPASAIVLPPGALMESDGRISRSWQGYAFDEQRSDSASREPPDVSLISGTPADPQASTAPTGGE